MARAGVQSPPGPLHPRVTIGNGETETPPVGGDRNSWIQTFRCAKLIYSFLAPFFATPVTHVVHRESVSQSHTLPFGFRSFFVTDDLVFVTDSLYRRGSQGS